jgi:hypothetical protein
MNNTQPTKRNVFEYHNGERTVRIDPQPIARRVLGNQDFTDLFKDVQMQEMVLKKLEKFKDDQEIEKIDREVLANGNKAHEKLVNALRDVFGLKEYTFDGQKESGVTEDEVWNVWEAFNDYLKDVKKNTNKTPKQQESTAQPSLVKSTAKPVLASGSTVTK